MEKKKEVKITVRFPPDVIEVLRPLAQEEDRSLNGEIVQAVREYIAKRRKERTGAVPFHDQTIIAVRLADGRICVAAKEEAKGELEQFDEPGLFKIKISSKCLGYSTVLHDVKTCGINQAPILIESPTKERDRQSMTFLANMHNFNTR